MPFLPAPSPAKRGRDGEGAPTALPTLPTTRIAAALVFLLLAAVIVAPANAQPAQSPPPGTRTECNSAGLAFAAIGESRLQTYSDGHGRTVELWCIRRVFGSNYDVRITEAGRTVTIAFCYFAQARNTGPILHLAPSGAYTKVEWINESLTATGTSYRFSYDLAAREITITATSACRPAVTTTVPPQPDVQHLERLLPPSAECS